VSVIPESRQNHIYAKAGCVDPLEGGRLWVVSDHSAAEIPQEKTLCIFEFAGRILAVASNDDVRELTRLLEDFGWLSQRPGEQDDKLLRHGISSLSARGP
jgi:hypothetical protein